MICDGLPFGPLHCHDAPAEVDERLFWHGARQSLCDFHHKSAKYHEENKGYVPTIGSDGWPVDPRHPVYARD